jgi:tripartite-type tricarboxylate transporter receptor subunit TctC
MNIITLPSKLLARGFTVLTTFVLLFSIQHVNAQDTLGVGSWPTQKPIRLIVVFPPGGTVDQIARLMAPALQNELKQTVTVTNVAGASGVIGTNAMLQAPADGYTFAFVFDSHSVNPTLKDSLPYDTLKDIVTINTIGTSPMILAASKKSNITNIKQLIADSKSKKTFSYGTYGIGSLGHLAIANFSQKMGLDWTHIPYRGGAPMIQDGLSGQVPLVVGSLFLIKPHADNGMLIPLAVTTAKRNPDIPNVPTFAENGYPGFDAPSWLSIIANSKMSPAIIEAMYKATDKVLKTPEIAEKLKVQGITVASLNPEASQHFLAKQIALWGKFVIQNNIKE